MLLLAMTAAALVSSSPTVQANAVAPQHTMTVVNAAAQERLSHAGTVPMSVRPLTAQLSPYTAVQKAPHVTMTALQP